MSNNLLIGLLLTHVVICHYAINHTLLFEPKFQVDWLTNFLTRFLMTLLGPVVPFCYIVGSPTFTVFLKRAAGIGGSLLIWPILDNPVLAGQLVFTPMPVTDIMGGVTLFVIVSYLSYMTIPAEVKEEVRNANVQGCSSRTS